MPDENEAPEVRYKRWDVILKWIALPGAISAAFVGWYQYYDTKATERTIRKQKVALDLQAPVWANKIQVLDTLSSTVGEIVSAQKDSERRKKIEAFWALYNGQLGLYQGTDSPVMESARRFAACLSKRCSEATLQGIAQEINQAAYRQIIREILQKQRETARPGPATPSLRGRLQPNPY